MRRKVNSVSNSILDVAQQVEGADEVEGAGMSRMRNIPNNNLEEDGEVSEDWLLKKIDVNHLSAEQQRRVKLMLKKHVSVFSKDKLDIGEIKDLKMKINLHDYEPVKRSYTLLPKPLYKQVKEFVEDMLAQGWVQKSSPSYISPLVYARKKD